MRKLFVSLALLGMWNGAAHSAPKAGLPESLQGAMSEAKPKLGKLEDWQSVVFDTEAVPQYSRFIRDYRPSPGGVVADVDLESVRGFLAISGFSAAKPEAKNQIVVLRAGSDCRKCSDALPLIRKVMLARLERRGFQAVFPEKDALGEGQTQGAALRERVSELARRQGAAGALVLEWQMLPADIEHPGEDLYGLRVFQLTRQDGPSGVKEFKAERNVELRLNDGFVPASEKLLTDTFTEVGAKVLALRSAPQTESPGAELRIAVAGIRDFAHFSAIKAKIQAALQDWGVIEERGLVRGEAIWAVPARKKASELKRALAGMKVVASDEESVKVAAE